MAQWPDHKKSNCNREAQGMSATERRNVGNHAVGEQRGSDVQLIADALRIRGRVLLRTHGSSMLPWMRPGDISRVRRTSVEDVRCGDLVLFRRHNRLFVHRIVDERVRLGVRQVSAKGDAHPDSDGWLEMDELLGRVVVIYRRGRHIRLETRSQVALGRVIAQLSLWSRFWYPAARFVAVTSRPMRRTVSHWLATTEAIR